MRLFTELHTHSRFARGCSTNLNLQNITKWTKIKGLNLVGTGDFTHPEWLSELKQNLKDEGKGIYSFDSFPFILTTEVANFFEQNGHRQIHQVLLAPSFEVVDQINEFLSKYGSLSSDGRPILHLSSSAMVEALKQISPDIEIIPAHAWTPHFSLFGSRFGFDSVKDCYQDQTKNIHAIETGMSSDPQMNWRLSQLDNLQIVSFSDSHSFWPWRMGRECTIFDIDLNYKELISAIRTGENLTGTVEVDPGYGKYHYDGHRDCNVWMDPEQSKKYNNRCPKCSRPLTIGVMNRVEQLADRPADYVPKNRPPFYTLMPLAELIAAHLKASSVSAKTVLDTYNEFVEKFSSEFEILLNANYETLVEAGGEPLANLIMLNRQNKLTVQPGYDGVYGKLLIDSAKAVESDADRQKTVLDY
jgi:uncharacterized protein (TIGR00375 family)